MVKHSLAIFTTRLMEGKQKLKILRRNLPCQI
nr:MAG TPA: hypothetical protein [Caudoviricetes sp.]